MDSHLTYNTRSPLKLSGHEFQMRLVSLSCVFLQTHSVAQEKEGAYGELQLVRLRIGLLSEGQGTERLGNLPKSHSYDNSRI